MERIIIIPAFRPDKYLKQLVRRNWELENQMIVVDDGSGQEYRPLFEESGEDQGRTGDVREVLACTGGEAFDAVL